MSDATQHSGVSDLITVQMKDRQNHAVADGIKKFIGVPRSGKRSRFRFSIANHGCDDQIRVVKGGAVSVGKNITQLAAFVNGARSLRCHMAGDAARKGELLE